MEYILVTGLHDDFHREIADRLSEGWKLYHGPIDLGTWRCSQRYAQAMTREKDFTNTFHIITGTEGEWNAAAEMCDKYGYELLGEPQRTGKTIGVAGDEYPEYAQILMKKEDV